MRLKDGFITHQIQGTQMLVSTEETEGSFHGLFSSNETAAFIVDQLKTETTPEKIVEEILAVYDVSAEIAMEDVQMVIGKLESIGALA